MRRPQAGAPPRGGGMRRPQAGAPPARSAEARRGGKRGRGDKCDISLRAFGPYFEILWSWSLCCMSVLAAALARTRYVYTPRLRWVALCGFADRSWSTFLNWPV